MDNFFLNLALGAFVLSLLLALFSFVVYFFRLAFLSIAVSHAVLAGLAIGVFLGVEPTISALVFSLLVGWLIAFLRRKTGLTEDASIGIVLALAMAVGIILIYLSGYQGNLLAYLFGSITTISPTDVAILFLFLLAGGLFFKFNFEKILYLCFDEESAYASGINTDFLYYTLVGMLSFIVTFATKLAGLSSPTPCSFCHRGGLPAGLALRRTSPLVGRGCPDFNLRRADIGLLHRYAGGTLYNPRRGDSVYRGLPVEGSKGKSL